MEDARHKMDSVTAPEDGKPGSTESTLPPVDGQSALKTVEDSARFSYGQDTISSKTLVNELMWDILTPFDAKTAPETTSNCAYFAPRFCTRCCRQWGDIDVLLDIRSRRTGIARSQIWHEMLQQFLKYVPERGSQPNVHIRGPCCTTNAIAPQQHNLCDFWKHSVHLTNSNIGTFPSALYVTSKRAPPASGRSKEEGMNRPELLLGFPSLDSIATQLRMTQ